MIQSKEKSIAIYVDCDSKSGLGHISRVSGLIEFLEHKSALKPKLFLSDPHSNIDWLLDSMSLGNITISDFDAPLDKSTAGVVIDSYQDWAWSHVRDLAYPIVGVVDAFSERNFATDIALVIELEKNSNEVQPAEDIFSSRFCAQRRLSGSLIWNSRLETAFQSRNIVQGKGLLWSDQIVVCFGGSELASRYADQIVTLLKNNYSSAGMKITVFSAEPPEGAWLNSNLGVEIRWMPLSSNILERVAESDLLICSSGSLAREAYHLGIPSIIINLFDNAEGNHYELRQIFTSAVFLESDFDEMKKQLPQAIQKLSEQEVRSQPTKENVIEPGEIEQQIRFALAT
jgi:spore coat polysaccharide biosynthesis predicted glycosyltransferase SpsG